MLLQYDKQERNSLMNDLENTCRLALIQASPVLFDAEASTDKAVHLIAKASQNHPDLIVFPELFIPGYPYGLTFGYTVGHRNEESRKDWLRYYDNSILIPGKETELLGNAAKKAHAFLSIGVSERDAVNGTLYNSNIIFTPDGKIDAVHRKLKPTGAERLIWGDADQHYFPVTESPWGPIGNLICWESYMPLARAALYQKGVTIYISCNTNDNEEWQNTIRHIALEGRCYFINADQYFTKNIYPSDLHEPAITEITKLPEVVCRGGSCVIDPSGHPLHDPVWDKEEIIFEDLDMNKVSASKMEFDPVGHYARNDVLKLIVKDE